jgi:hypothetical protein
VQYGFLDEAGDVGYARGSSSHFLVVVLVTGQPERLRKAVTQTRKSLSKRRRNIPELKAARGSVRIVEKLLRRAHRIGFEAVTVVIDKRLFPQPQDVEDLYRYACTRVVREALRRFGALSLILDKRYTNPDLRRRLNQALAEGIEDLGTALVLEHTDSETEYALQVADAVAWSLLQKYEHQDQRLWKIIEGRTIEVRL